MQICQYHNKKLCIFAVAPFAGAWIEILTLGIDTENPIGRSLRGSVDWNSLSSCRWSDSVMSLPSRERGLKYIHPVSPNTLCKVAPFAGAWIEIFQRRLWNSCVRSRSLRGSVDWNNAAIITRYVNSVAPFAGAWIEIYFNFVFASWAFVAPFAGAWIEITHLLHLSFALTVAPFAGAWIEIQVTEKISERNAVAPFAGAWIEILLVKANWYCLWVAPFAGAWIEMQLLVCRHGKTSRRSLRGSVDWNYFNRLLSVLHLRRSLRGSVDWNTWNNRVMGVR